MTVDINGASQTFIFQRDFTPTGRQNGIKMEGFEGTNLTADGVIILWPLVCAINIYFIVISKKKCGYCRKILLQDYHWSTQELVVTGG